MNPGIFLIQDNEELVEMNEQPYDSEKLLQSWLAKYPAFLVGNQINTKEPRRWLFIEQECSVPSEEGGSNRWAIDHLFLDQDAIPTIVEVKRSTDTRIRREVVGQMLDYAANAVAYWPVSHMRERFAANCQSSGLDADEKLKEVLGEGIEPEEFWEKANRNLHDHTLRLLFVADVIPTELQRVVEFLNEQMDRTEVLAIEIKQFVGQGRRGLVPRVIGQTTEAHEKKSGPRAERQWDEASVLQAIEQKRGIDEANVAQKLIDWSKQNASRINWGKGASDGSFSAVFDQPSGYSFIPFRVYTSGSAEILFNRMIVRHNAPFDVEVNRIELLRRLNELPGVDLPEDGISCRPSISLMTLVSPNALTIFLNVFAWATREVEAVQTVSGGNGVIDTRN